MSSEKLLIIVYSENQVNKGFGLIQEMVSREDTILLALNFETQFALGKKKIPYQTPKDYIDERTFLNLDKEAMELGSRWYKQKDLSQLISYGDFNLAELVEREMSFFFAFIIETINLFKAVTQKETFSQVIIFDDWEGEITAINPETYENVPPQMVVTLERLMKAPVKVIRVAGLHRKSTKLEFNCRKYAAKAIVKLVNFWQGRCRSPKETIAILNQWSEVKTVLQQLKSRDIIFFGSAYQLGKEMFTGDLREFLSNRVRLNVYDDYISPDIVDKVNEYRVEITKRWQKIKEGSETLRSSFVYQGVDIWPLIEPRLDYVFLQLFPDAVRRIETTKRFVDKEKVKLFLFHDDALHERKTVATVARNLGIESLVIQHGVLGHPIDCLPLRADRIAVWGEGMADWFIRHGISAKRVPVTGCPRFDRYFAKPKRSREEVCKRLNIDPSTQKVVLALQWSSRRSLLANIVPDDQDIVELSQFVFECVREVAMTKLIIKFAPRDRRAKIYMEILKDSSGDEITFVTDTDPFDVLTVCDVLVTFSSTMALEAMILGKPAIIINFRGKNLYNPYTELGKPLIVRTKEELNHCFAHLFRDKQAKGNLKKVEEFAYRYAHIPDGQASRRVAELIEAQLK